LTFTIGQENEFGPFPNKVNNQTPTFTIYLHEGDIQESIYIPQC